MGRIPVAVLGFLNRCGCIGIFFRKLDREGIGIHRRVFIRELREYWSTGTTVSPVVNLQKKSDLGIVIEDPYRDRVVERSEQSLLLDNIGYQSQCGGGCLLPISIIYVTG